MGISVSKARKDEIETVDVNDQNSLEETIIQKVYDSPAYKKKFEGQDHYLQIFAKALSNKDVLKTTYLSTDWVESLKLYNSIRQEEGNKKLKNGKTSLLSSAATSETTTSVIPEQFAGKSGVGEYLEGDRGGEEEEEISELQLKQNPDLKLKNSIKIKIVISEIATTQFKKSFREVVSPFLSAFNISPEFGMFHSALLIGPWLIEWNNSALAVPRICVSSAAFLTADIDAIETLSQVNHVIDTLADGIIHWNTSMKYNDKGGDKSKEGNCQDFVSDMLQRLNIKAQFNGCLGRFLKNLRDTGKATLGFHTDSEFREKFNMSEKLVTFKTHKELDKFVTSLLEIEPEFMSKYKDEWALLKSFDRAFWMKHFRFSNDPTLRKNFEPLSESDENFETGEEVLRTVCPFGDPNETYSIRFNGSI